MVTVVRNGAEKEIGVADIVLDDVMQLRPGNQVCADGVMLEGSVEVNESLITGESDVVAKGPGDFL